MISNFQYVMCCLAFSKGKPWRRPMYTNLLFTISAVILLLVDTIIVVVPLNTDGFLYWSFLSLLPLPSWYRLRLIAPAIVLNSVITFCVEYFIIAECVTKRADKK
jgi:cation-transporting ATPase 13A3/4/5